MNPPPIIIVGGGAGGLELATQLGNTLGRRGRARITLVDARLTHLWKPLLHEVAAGTFDSHENDVDYLAQAHHHHFDYRLGRLEGLNRAEHQVTLAAEVDEAGNTLIPRRTIGYDTLIIAVGSVTHDFNVPGVTEHCTFLDTREQADAFQQSLLRSYVRAQTRHGPVAPGELAVVIVGAGATGVELAAELHNVAHQLVAYGFDRIDPARDVRLILLEAADRILPNLSERVAAAAERQLRRLGVEIHTAQRVTRVTADAVETGGGTVFAARHKVWAAGIKAPELLRDLDGLETNQRNQLLVRPTLQTTRDDDVFAFGDCAACPRPGRPDFVPPTAQAAHQQAAMLVKSMRRRLQGRPLPEFVYHDRGSLVSLSEYTTVGSLMGNLWGSFVIEGWFARLSYRTLYRFHQRALYGTVPTMLLVVSDFLQNRARTRLKLH